MKRDVTLGQYSNCIQKGRYAIGSNVARDAIKIKDIMALKREISLEGPRAHMRAFVKRAQEGGYTGELASA